MINKKGIAIGFPVSAAVLIFAFAAAFIYLTYFLETDVMKATISIDDLEEATECRAAIFAVLADEYYRGDNSGFSSDSPYRALSDIYPGETRYQYYENINNLNTYLSNTDVFSVGQVRGGIEKGRISTFYRLEGENRINCNAPMYGVVSERLLISKGIDKVRAFLSIGYTYE